MVDLLSLAQLILNKTEAYLDFPIEAFTVQKAGDSLNITITVDGEVDEDAQEELLDIIYEEVIQESDSEYVITYNETSTQNMSTTIFVHVDNADYDSATEMFGGMGPNTAGISGPITAIASPVFGDKKIKKSTEEVEQITNGQFNRVEDLYKAYVNLGTELQKYLSITKANVPHFQPSSPTPDLGEFESDLPDNDMVPIEIFKMCSID